MQLKFIVDVILKCIQFNAIYFANIFITSSTCQMKYQRVSNRMPKPESAKLSAKLNAKQSAKECQTGCQMECQMKFQTRSQAKCSRVLNEVPNRMPNGASKREPEVPNRMSN